MSGAFSPNSFQPGSEVDPSGIETLSELKAALTILKGVRTPLLQLCGGMAILAHLAVSDGLRIFHAYTETAVGPIALGALAFLLTVGIAVSVVLTWTKMSMLTRRVAFCLVPAWFLLMLFAFVATHRMRGMRLFYEAVGEPNSPWSIAVITYQACVWMVALAVLPIGALMWRRAGP